MTLDEALAIMPDDFVMSPLTQIEILMAVKDQDWQRFRVSLKGLSTEQKMANLSLWVGSNPSNDRYIQAVNYINALKRGGQIV